MSSSITQGKPKLTPRKIIGAKDGYRGLFLIGCLRQRPAGLHRLIARIILIAHWLLLKQTPYQIIQV
jgi:hypothetical protein